MDLRIEGKTALVLGASRGLGAAVAEALVEEGANVAVVSRDRDRIEAAAAELGDHATAFVADTAEVTTLPALVAEVTERVGPIDILITNTGGPPPGSTFDHPIERWEAAHRSLVLAPLALIESVLPTMRERSWGRIVNITSTSVEEPIEGLVLSNAYRAAAVGLFKTLSRELAPEGILLNSVAPGRIATDRIAELSGTSLDELRKQDHPDIPVGRLGRPQEFAAAVTFLCSEQASYVVGVNLPVDGGVSRSA